MPVIQYTALSTINEDSPPTSGTWALPPRTLYPYDPIRDSLSSDPPSGRALSDDDEWDPEDLALSPEMPPDQAVRSSEPAVQFLVDHDNTCYEDHSDATAPRYATMHDAYDEPSSDDSSMASESADLLFDWDQQKWCDPPANNISADPDHRLTDHISASSEGSDSDTGSSAHDNSPMLQAVLRSPFDPFGSEEYDTWSSAAESASTLAEGADIDSTSHQWDTTTLSWGDDSSGHEDVCGDCESSSQVHGSDSDGPVDDRHFNDSCQSPLLTLATAATQRLQLELYRPPSETAGKRGRSDSFDDVPIAKARCRELSKLMTGVQDNAVPEPGPTPVSPERCFVDIAAEKMTCEGKMYKVIWRESWVHEDSLPPLDQVRHYHYSQHGQAWDVLPPSPGS